jgi:hypothetical protein
MAINHSSLETYAYAFTEPLTANITTNLFGNQIYSPVHKTPFLMNKYVLDSASPRRGRWSGWEVAPEGTSINFSINDGWVNHDVIASDGTKPFVGSEPVPVYLPCVLFDGEITAETDAGNFTFDVINYLFGLAPGDVLGITFDGVYEECTVEFEYEGEPYSLVVGNRGLTDSDAEDDGRDFYMCNFYYFAPYHGAYFYTRTPGTYHLKIELIATAKE